MSFEQRDMSGALFKNDKGGNEARPDYRGDAMVNGEAVEIAAWIKTSQKGTKFMSLSFKPKQERQDAKPAPKPAARNTAPFDDDLPDF